MLLTLHVLFRPKLKSAELFSSRCYLHWDGQTRDINETPLSLMFCNCHLS